MMTASAGPRETCSHHTRPRRQRQQRTPSRSLNSPESTARSGLRGGESSSPPVSSSRTSHAGVDWLAGSTSAFGARRLTAAPGRCAACSCCNTRPPTAGRPVCRAVGSRIDSSPASRWRKGRVAWRRVERQRRRPMTPSRARARAPPSRLPTRIGDTFELCGLEGIFNPNWRLAAVASQLP
jgi:hypothetical protein